MQNFTSYHMYLEFSDDASRLNIYNRKPLRGDRLKVPEVFESSISDKDLEVDADFKTERSMSSCNLSEVIDFHYGGTNSRFWMLRKHINAMTAMELQKLPFYCWQCITLKFAGRDVDLVICDDNDMDLLIRHLIYNLYTIDGRRDSAKPLLEKLQVQNEEEHKKKSGRPFIERHFSELIRAQNEHMVFRKIKTKYLIQ